MVAVSVSVPAPPVPVLPPSLVAMVSTTPAEVPVPMNVGGVEARNALELDKGDKLLVMGMGDKGLMLMKVSAFEKMSAEMAQQQAAIESMIKNAK